MPNWTIDSMPLKALERNAAVSDASASSRALPTPASPTTSPRSGGLPASRSSRTRPSAWNAKSTPNDTSAIGTTTARIWSCSRPTRLALPPSHTISIDRPLPTSATCQ